MVNVFGVGKNLGAAAIHIANGNAIAASASVVKAGVSCIPVVGHIPGIGHLVDEAITRQTSSMPGYEVRALHNWLDADDDGDIDLDDLSNLMHDFFNSF